MTTVANNVMRRGSKVLAVFACEDERFDAGIQFVKYNLDGERSQHMYSTSFLPSYGKRQK